MYWVHIYIYIYIIMHIYIYTHVLYMYNDINIHIDVYTELQQWSIVVRLTTDCGGHPSPWTGSQICVRNLSKVITGGGGDVVLRSHIRS